MRNRNVSLRSRARHPKGKTLANGESDHSSLPSGRVQVSVGLSAFASVAISLRFISEISTEAQRTNWR